MSSKDSGHSSSKEIQVPSQPLPRPPHPLPGIDRRGQTPGSRGTEDFLCRNPVREKSQPFMPECQA